MLVFFSASSSTGFCKGSATTLQQNPHTEQSPTQYLFLLRRSTKMQEYKGFKFEKLKSVWPKKQVLLAWWQTPVEDDTEKKEISNKVNRARTIERA